ncbi:MAG: sodium:solute symporter family protein [Deltaproteobacteria bacterium]|nr:sodium:solute symporter family protein [Deltaproteobacteria bacterium]
MELNHNPDLLWYVLGYGLIMVVLGIKFSRRITSSDDFIVAGRALGSLVLIGTLLATFTGSGAITGGANSFGFLYGFWPTMVILIFPGIITFIALYFLAPKIRSSGKYTISQILKDRYGESARLLSAIIIILAYVGIVSIQFKGLGFVLHVTTGISVGLGTFIGAILIIFLAGIGGLLVVAKTDAISALLMVCGLVFAIPYMLHAGGGWTTISANLPPENLTFLGSLSLLQIAGYAIPFIFLQLGDQNIYQRLVSSKAEHNAKVGVVGWIVSAAIVTGMIAFIAMVARSIFTGIDPGIALISSSVVIPTFFGGIMLAAAAAFVVTTGNSYLLSASTSITYDIYVRYFRPEAGSREILTVTRLIIPILGLISYVLLQFFPTILQIQMISYAVYGAGITPAVLAVFIWPRANKSGGISSMIVGVVSTIAWEAIKPVDVMGAAVGVPLAILTLIVVTMLTSKPSKKVE